MSRFALAFLLAAPLCSDAGIVAVAQAKSGKPSVHVVADEPRDVVAAIYDATRARLRTKNPESPFFDRKLRRKYFSKAFDLQIAKAEKNAARDGDAAIDFDPITASQDPDIGPVTLKSDLLGPDKAMVSARFDNRGEATVVTYDLVKEGGRWRVADIEGTTDKQAWSVRNILKDAGHVSPSGVEDADKASNATEVQPPKGSPDKAYENGAR